MKDDVVGACLDSRRSEPGEAEAEVVADLSAAGVGVACDVDPGPSRSPGLTPERRRAIATECQRLIVRAASLVARRYNTWLTADDLVQEGWILADRILERWCPALGRNMTVQQWLYLVLCKSLADHVRNVSRFRVPTKVIFVANLVGESYADEQDRVFRDQKRFHERDVLQRDAGFDLDDVAGQLTDLQRDLIRLRYAEGLSVPRITRRLGIGRFRVRREIGLALKIIGRSMGL